MKRIAKLVTQNKRQSLLFLILAFVVMMVFLTSHSQTPSTDYSPPLFYQSHVWYSSAQQQHLLQLNLFGASAPVESDKNDSFLIKGQPLSQYVIDNAPPIESDEQLTGIVYSSRRAESIMTLRTSEGQQTYTEGQTIQVSNEKILLITPDKVIVDLNGYYRSITLQN